MPSTAALLTVGLNHYLVFAALLFTIGLIGVLVRRNTIVILLCIELMLNATNVVFVSYGRYLGNNDGQITVFFVMAIAAAEAAIGLAIAVNIFKRFKGINIRNFENLRG